MRSSINSLISARISYYIHIFFVYAYYIALGWAYNDKTSTVSFNQKCIHIIFYMYVVEN